MNLYSLLEGISQTSLFLVKRQIDKASNSKLEKMYNAKLRAFALTLHYISPKAYNYVRKVFDTCLPHPKTLAAWSKSVRADPGFCSESLNALKLFCDTKTEPVLGSLILDSMAIKKFVEWDGSKFLGYVNFGIELNDDGAPLAKEALVFLLNCINGSWKFPVAYFFVDGISGEQLSTLVLRALTLINETGVIVSSLTFDGTATNISMATHLGCSLKSDNLLSHFPHPVTGSNIYIFLDPCHMLKLVRNTLGIQPIESNSGSVQWKFIENLEKVQNAEGLHLANKLSKAHIRWEDQKMKVKLAAQTLSESVAVGMKYLREKGYQDFLGCEATCEFVEIFNILFDILNSRNNKGFSFKKALNETNFPDTKIKLLDIFNYISQLKDLKGRALTQGNRKVGFIGFQIDILSAIGIFEELVVKNHFLKYVPLYKISQDHLELLFSKIRARGGWNNNPTVRQFCSALKKIIICQELQEVETGNCIPLEKISILYVSSAYSSAPLMSINGSTESYRMLDNDENPDALLDHQYVKIPSDIIISEISKEIVTYISGFVARHLVKKIMCPECCSSLLAEKDIPGSLIQLKSKGGLVTPSEDLIKVCLMAEKWFRGKFIRIGCLGRIAPTTNLVDVNESTREIVRNCISTSLFDSLNTHIFNDLESNHLIHLIKCICLKFFDIRLRHVAKNVSNIIHTKKIDSF